MSHIVFFRKGSHQVPERSQRLQLCLSYPLWMPETQQKHEYIYRLNIGCGLTLYRECHMHIMQRQGFCSFVCSFIVDDISVIYVTAHRCAGGLKKACPTVWLPRHRHLVGFFNKPGQAQTRDHPFYGPSERPDSSIVQWGSNIQLQDDP